MIHSFPSSASMLLLSTGILLSSFSTNTSPLANALTIARARSPVSNDVVVDPRAINARDPLDSNGNQQRDGIFGPGPEPDQDVAVIIPRVFTPAVVVAKTPKKPDEDTPDEDNDAPEKDTPDEDNDAPEKDTHEGDVLEEDPPKPHKTGDQRKKHPKPDDPEKCDDGNRQNREPCPSENGKSPA